jgi:hypothetical protein
VAAAPTYTDAEVVDSLTQNLEQSNSQSSNAIGSAQTPNTVGQLIFDIEGEYANDNPQDNNRSLRRASPNYCIVYALTPKTETPSRQLRLNFYDLPDASHRVLAELLEQDKRTSICISSFSAVQLPSIDELEDLPQNERLREARKILWYDMHMQRYAKDDR